MKSDQFENNRVKYFPLIFPRQDIVFSSQVEYQNNLQKNLKKGECMIQVDCSEVYHNKNQDEIQSAYFDHQTFHIFTACGYFRPSKTANIEKFPVTSESEVNDQSHIASFICVLKVIDCIEESTSLLSSLQRIYIWSDGCSAQFYSRFTLVLTHLHPGQDIE